MDNQSFGKLAILRVNTPGGTPTITNLSLTVPSTAYPVQIDHPNSTGVKLDPLDDRLFAATLRNGHLWTAHNIGVTSSGVASGTADRTASRWYDITNLTSTPTLNQSGTVYDNNAAASAARSYWIPSIAVNGQGAAAMGFSTGGAAFNPDAATTGRACHGPARHHGDADHLHQRLGRV